MKPRAVLFDVMGTLFDLSPLDDPLARLGAQPPTREAWFQRALDTARTLTIVGEFKPFATVATRALETTLAAQEPETDGAADIVQAIGELPAYETAPAALGILREAGIRVGVLSNGAQKQSRKLLDAAGLAVDAVFSVDEVKKYKPHPEPYLRAVGKLGLEQAQVTLVAAHGWDVVGARNAGLGTVWVRRTERTWPFPLREPPSSLTLDEAARMAVGPRR